MQAQGKRVPVLDDAPTIAPEALPYWNAYQTLSAMRLSISGEPQPLQFSEIRAYTTFLGYLSDDEADEMFSIIRAMDACFLEDTREKRYKAEQTAAKKAEEASRRSKRR